MKLNSDMSSIAIDISGNTALLVFAILYNIVIIRFLFLGIRSLMKKNLNFPPNKNEWEKVKVEPVNERRIELAGEAESANMYNDLQYHMTGMRYKTTPQHTARYCKLKYEYNGLTYETGTMKYSSNMEIYCRRNHPEIIKTYIPKYPMHTTAAISVLFLATFMIFMELVFISNT